MGLPCFTQTLVAAATDAGIAKKLTMGIIVAAKVAEPNVKQRILCCPIHSRNLLNERDDYLLDNP